ncbi:hypothetical protein AB1L30_16970 [Bremerella sp. JC817]|uniref:hypothetical protein n=1 Tax=Bremerella sp. JC817 TaxID=3231756 RepID=UPI0034592253
MTPFRVQCPTCAARLKVTSRSLIGQIVNCPKCGSMIEIAEPGPAGGKPEAAKPAKKQTEEKPKVAATPPVAPPAPVEPPEPETANVEVSDSEAMFDNLDEMLDHKPEVAPVAAGASDAAPPETTPEIDRFSDTASVGKWRNVALIGGTSVMALTTFAVIGYSVFSGKATPPPVDPNENQPVEVSQADPPVEEEPVTTEEPEAKEPVEAALPETPPEGVPVAEMPAEEETPAETETTEQPKPGPIGKPADPMMPTDDNPFLFDNPDAANPPEPTPDKPADPPTDAGNPVVAARSPSILELKDDPLYEVFGESFPILDPSAFENAGGSAPNAPAAATTPEPVVSVQPELVPPIPVVDVAQRLGDPIVRIEFQGMPLNDFASFVTQMSTVPVTIDPLALAAADIKATTPITINQTQTSVQGILDSAIRPFGLETHVTDKSARISITQPLDGHRRTQRLLVDDLVENQQQVADIAYMLTHLVEPLSWKQSRGEGLYRIDPDAIMVTQSEVAQFKALVFLEKLRVARGLMPRSKYNPELFSLTSREQQLAPALLKDVKIQIVVPTPMFKVVDQLEKKTGLTILCDWDSLALNKIGPATPVTLSAPGVTAGQALDQFCKAWKLEALPINATTVQLVAEQTVPIMPWLEAYDVSHLNLSKSSAAAMINDTKRELTDLRKTTYGELLYDPISKKLFALLSNDDHRRLKFALERKRSS